jgi:anti-sigma regulatory factor (Ser/Thr protein kinase)
MLDRNGVGHPRRSFDAGPDTPRLIRAFVSDALRGWGATDDVIDDVRLAASELAANAVEYGDGTGVTVSVDCDDMWWVLQVESGSADHTATSRPDTWEVAPAAAISGRGLGIVRRLMDDVEAWSRRGTIVIVCRRSRTSRASRPIDSDEQV